MEPRVLSPALPLATVRQGPRPAHVDRLTTGAHRKLSGQCRWPTGTAAVRPHGEVQNFFFLNFYFKTTARTAYIWSSAEGSNECLLFFRRNVESPVDHTGEGQGFPGNSDNPAHGNTRGCSSPGQGGTLHGHLPTAPSRPGRGFTLPRHSPPALPPHWPGRPWGDLPAATFLSDSAHSLPARRPAALPHRPHPQPGRPSLPWVG